MPELFRIFVGNTLITLVIIMNNMDERERKCFEFVCMNYPKCARAAGSCCALDDFFEEVTIGRSECFDLPEKPLFKEKKTWKYG